MKASKAIKILEDIIQQIKDTHSPDDEEHMLFAMSM